MTNEGAAGATTKTAPTPPKPTATSQIAAYPSRLIKPIPSFLFAVPRGFVVDEAPDALCVVRAPKEVDGFWINAILSHDRVPRSVDFKQAAQITFARMKRSSPDATATMERLARFGANVVYLRGVEMKAPKTGRGLAQVQALFFAPANDKGKTVDFFQFIATAPSELMPRFGKAFVEMISSFKFV
jgi:hypothetical protein